MAKKKLRKRETISDPHQNDILVITHFEVTDEPIVDRAYRRLPEEIKEKLDHLFYLAHRRPEKAIPDLVALKARYPKISQIYNYLSAAYSRAGEIEKAEAVTKECIQKNPKYLFARINQAQLYLARKEYEKIPGIFKNTFDLQSLYPNRRRYHISEVANFMGIVGLYHLRTDQREIAETYNEILQEIASNYPLSKKLNRELYPGFIRRMVRRFLGKSTIE